MYIPVIPWPPWHSSPDTPEHLRRLRTRLGPKSIDILLEGSNDEVTGVILPGPGRRHWWYAKPAHTCATQRPKEGALRLSPR